MMLLDNHFGTPLFTCIVCPGAGGGRRGGMREICGTHNVSLRNSKRSSAQASLTRVSMRPSPVCAFTTTARVRTDISPEHPHTALELFPMLARGCKPNRPLKEHRNECQFRGRATNCRYVDTKVHLDGRGYKGTKLGYGDTGVNYSELAPQWRLLFQWSRPRRACSGRLRSPCQKWTRCRVSLG
jgi:hypothetical protein